MWDLQEWQYRIIIIWSTAPSTIIPIGVMIPEAVQYNFGLLTMTTCARNMQRHDINNHYKIQCIKLVNIKINYLEIQSPLLIVYRILDLCKYPLLLPNIIYLILPSKARYVTCFIIRGTSVTVIRITELKLYDNIFGICNTDVMQPVGCNRNVMSNETFDLQSACWNI